MPSDPRLLGDDCPSLSAGSDEPIDNSDGLGLVRYGKLQIGQAARVPLGAAGVAHQPQEDLVAGGMAVDHAGGVSKTHTSVMGPVRPQCHSARWRR